MIVTVTLNPSLDEWVYLPRLVAGRLNRATHFRRYPGGKGINVSRVAHELGVSTLAIALAGGDDGDILSRRLERDGLPHRFVTVRGSTRNNYEIITQHPHALTQINAPGPRATPGALARLERVMRRACRRAQALALSGSVPPGAPADIYARLLRGAARARVLTVLDASGSALREGLAGRPWMVKPNRDELEELLGARLRTQRQVARAALALTARGPSLVAVSLGPDGAVLASGPLRRCWWARPPAVRVDSAVGAGDSLVAGFLIGWRRRGSLPEALRLGVACGTAAAMTPGTELCRRADVRRLAPRVRVEEIG